MEYGQKEKGGTQHKVGRMEVGRLKSVIYRLELKEGEQREKEREQLSV